MDRNVEPARTEAEIEEAFAIADLVRRVAGDTGVHVYELEVSSPTDYVCVLWVGEALETLLGPTPEGLDPEQAWEACIHPDDRRRLPRDRPRSCGRDARPRSSTGSWASTARRAGSGSAAARGAASTGA